MIPHETICTHSHLFDFKIQTSKIRHFFAQTAMGGILANYASHRTMWNPGSSYLIRLSGGIQGMVLRGWWCRPLEPYTMRMYALPSTALTGVWQLCLGIATSLHIAKTWIFERFQKFITSSHKRKNAWRFVFGEYSYPAIIICRYLRYYRMWLRANSCAKAVIFRNFVWDFRKILNFEIGIFLVDK